MSTRYSMGICWSEQDQHYISFVRELPGCMADGNTPQEAVNNLETIIGEWIEVAEEEGREIPEPLTQERLDQAVQQGWSEVQRKAVQLVLDAAAQLEAQQSRQLEFPRPISSKVIAR